MPDETSENLQDPECQRKYESFPEEKYVTDHPKVQMVCWFPRSLCMRAFIESRCLSFGESSMKSRASKCYMVKCDA